MQPESPALPPRLLNEQAIADITRKELMLFFSSSVAWLFLAAFIIVTLFAFFWGEAFFARNIADVRPMFEWMPILLIFLSATLTMKLWSDERRNGTLEHVLTQSVPLWQFVVGKFLACWLLLALALLLTLPLPITVAVLAHLDWGPVIAGYLASWLLGGAYLALGLAVSSRTDNPIVSLLLASALGGTLYVLGTPTITGLVSGDGAEWLRAMGTGARFESIARGVLDLSDLYYYVGLMLVCLCLNILFLERQRWALSSPERTSAHRLWYGITGLAVLNLLVANLWLAQLDRVRLDVTSGGLYSISDATRGYLNRLQEPLLLRGYFSERTHPMLAPLVPRLKDLMKEYAIASDGKVRVEFVDPQQSPELAEEAAEKYAIQPVPFQIADRYQSAIVSAYFDVLVEYGDEHLVLNFGDLIEVRNPSEQDVQVALNNPEYDLTRAIRQTTQAWQSRGRLFDQLNSNLTLTAYVTDLERTPPELAAFRRAAETLLTDLQRESGGRLLIDWIDPATRDADFRAQLAQRYGVNPLPVGVRGERSFYFNLILGQGERAISIGLDNTDIDALKQQLEVSIRRFSSGLTRTLAWVVPQVSPGMAQLNLSPQFTQLRQRLEADYHVLDDDLSDGRVSPEVDMLLVLAPDRLSSNAVRAVDRFLMQGGTLLLATSPFQARLSERALTMRPHRSGLEAWLEHQGLSILPKLVLDPRNAAFPVPVTRTVQGYPVQQLVMLDYPYFPDLRDDQLNRNSLITRGLPQVTIPWASPIIFQNRDKGRITPLLYSSDGSWLSDSLQVTPAVDEQNTGYLPQGVPQPYPLAVVVDGPFTSFFESANTATSNEGNQSVGQHLSQSPASARIVLLASNDLNRDLVLNISHSSQQDDYQHPLQLVMNAVDWALEDQSLLNIRSRSAFNRTLPPMDASEQLFWEYLNYVMALALLLAIWGVVQWRRRQRVQALDRILAGEAA